MKLFFNFFLFSTVIAFSQQNERILVWEENFNGNELNPAVWNFELGNGCPNVCGWGNNERQFYTIENHRLENGYLIITAKKDNNRVTSTRITTKGKKEFQYGRIEARLDIPTGKGIWPAFWMLGSNIKEVGWPKSGEIDIMEYVGKLPKTIYNSIHTQSSHGNTINNAKAIFDEVEEGFHTYAIDWTAEKIDFFIDDTLSYTYAPTDKTEATWPFDQPFFILINLAVGGNFGGPEVDESIYPSKYKIDYVKVWQ
ncbi:MAG: laminarinase [Flavobacteriales bacterium CG_4_9_14_3_um_filter_40_17]|nr:MAG: laminarinase [Flavobacteriales bacterium CG_4_9_14_3_um_filter_40_17]